MSVYYYNLWAALAALLAPLALIATRRELRKVRLRLVEELRSTLFKDEPNLPQLELAAARYSAEKDDSGTPGKARQALVLVWTGAAFFVAIGFVGFSLLMMPTARLLSAAPDFPRVTWALLWSTSWSLQHVGELARTVSILGIAFLGGYIFQIRYLVRATLNQELGALAFVRATLQIVQGMIVALVAYRVGGEVAGPDAHTAVYSVALATAFVFGLFPNLGLNKIAKIARVPTKDIDPDAMGASKVVPLETIEGIDAETAYRLEESNLFDVQNLATINPISLYAESPYPLLEIFDWVLQAQLCVNVGTKAFIALKEHKIRTIFDLERAVLAEGAPPDYVRGIGAVMFENASPAFRTAVGLPPTASDPAVPGIALSPEIVRHAAAIMGDDLHVHRLRALWRVMLRTTAGVAELKSPWLYETGPLPGDARFAEAPLKAPADEYARLAGHFAAEYAVLAAAPADAAAVAAKRAQCLEAVRSAIAADPAARERLRRLWNPAYLRKRGDEGALEIFFSDPEFGQLLDPLSLVALVATPKA